MITKEEFSEWKANPVTQAVKERFLDIKRDISDMMMSGTTLGDSSSKTEQSTARMVGRVEGLDYFLNATYDDGQSYGERYMNNTL